jgi:tRNA (cytidine/uridine-2'-O-)-methyltransferase
MFELVLFEPEIPPNTGNVMRLAANTGCRLHLVRPLGFTLTDQRLRRAGLDYRDGMECLLHEDWNACLRVLGSRRIYALTTQGGERYDAVRFQRGDVLLFGSETRGLPPAVHAQATGQLRLPMMAASRSMNLSNAVAVTVYEAWRQNGFDGAS